MRQPSEEEIRALEAEMEKLTVDDVLLQTAITLVNLGARKAGLAAPPGEQEPKRDLAQTRDAIEAARAIVPLLEQRHPEEVAPLKNALSQLQMAFVQLSGGAPTEAEKPDEEPNPDGPGPAQSSGRLWIPGQ